LDAIYDKIGTGRIAVLIKIEKELQGWNKKDGEITECFIDQIAYPKY
jgi:hypothetical protein